ncbi:MAG: LysR substrate-binding domain-containing protein, partial [Clostridium sp.]
PSLSQYIISIEKNIGVQLFDRSVSPIKLTYAGELFVKSAKEILKLKKRLDDSMADMADLKSGRLVVGVSHLRNSSLMPQVLPKFKERFPGVNLELKEGSIAELEVETIYGNIDIFIGSLPIGESFSYEVIDEEKLLLAVPPNHPMNKKNMKKSKKVSKSLIEETVIDLKEVAEEPFVLLRPEQNLHKMAVKLCKKAGFNPIIQIENKTIDSTIAMVIVGLGISIIPDSIIRYGNLAHNPVYYTIKDDEAKRKLVVAFKKNKELSKSAMEFIEVLKEVLKRD